MTQVEYEIAMLLLKEMADRDPEAKTLDGKAFKALAQAVEAYEKEKYPSLGGK